MKEQLITALQLCGVNQSYDMFNRILLLCLIESWKEKQSSFVYLKVITKPYLF